MLGSVLDHCLRLIVFPSCIDYLGVFLDDKSAMKRISETNSKRWLLALLVDGHHWVMIARRGTQVLFADPLGRDVAEYSLDLSLLLQEHSLLELPFPIQAPGSRECGKFVLYLAWLYCRFAGDLTKISRSFSQTDLVWNDRLVRSFADLHFTWL